MVKKNTIYDVTKVAGFSKIQQCFFFVTTEYQVLQAHLMVYQLSEKRPEIRCVLGVLDDGRISVRCIDSKIWANVISFSRIRLGHFGAKLIGLEYRRTSREYRLRLESIVNENNTCLFYANDEKVECAFIRTYLAPELEINLEDGYGNYVPHVPGVYHRLKYWMRRLIFLGVLRTNLDFSMWLGDRKYTHVCRCRPDLVNNETVIDLSWLMKEYGRVYMAAIKKSYMLMKGTLPEVLCIARDFDAKKLHQLEACQEKVIVKPHPANKYEFVQCFRETFTSGNMDILDTEIGAELVPFCFPSIKSVVVLYETSVAFTFSAYHKDIVVRKM